MPDVKIIGLLVLEKKILSPLLYMTAVAILVFFSSRHEQRSEIIMLYIYLKTF